MRGDLEFWLDVVPSAGEGLADEAAQDVQAALRCLGGGGVEFGGLDVVEQAGEQVLLGGVSPLVAPGVRRACRRALARTGYLQSRA